MKQEAFIKYMNSKLVILLILCVSIFLRFYNLGAIPSGLTNDEAGAIYNSYSIWKTGYDVTGKFLPLSINLDNSFSPVYIYSNAPFVGILGLSIFSGRLLFAFCGICTTILLFFLTKKLFKNTKIAILSMLVIAVSPWHLQISRSVYDATIALFFILFTIYIFISKAKNGNILWSLPTFILAFYSYHATKIYLFFLIPVLIFLYWQYLIHRKKELFIFIMSAFIIFFSFLFVFKTQNVTREDVFLVNDIKSATMIVNWEREKNTAPIFLRNLLSNKPLYFLRVVRENYLEAFSPQFLFLYGETGGLSGIYGTLFRGTMYIIELPLLILGFIFLLSLKDKKIKYLLLCSILIAPLPSAFTIDKTYVMRSIMLLPFLSIVVGCGIYYLLFSLKKLNTIIKVLIVISFISWYCFLVVEYLYQYHFRYNIYGAESWFRSSRDLAEYIGNNKEEFRNIYVVNPGNMFLFQYGIYNKIRPEVIQKAWNSQSPKKIENVWFISDCIDTHREFFDPEKYLAKNVIYITPGKCHQELIPKNTIKDSGEPLRIIWKIYENK